MDSSEKTTVASGLRTTRNTSALQPHRHPATLKPANTSPIKAKKAATKQKAKGRARTKAMVTNVTPPRRVTRARATQAASAPTQAEAPNQVPETPSTSPKRVRWEEPTLEPAAEAPQTPPSTPKERARRARAEDEDAPAEGGEIVVKLGSPRAARRSRRPKASDFYETQDSPTAVPESPPKRKTTNPQAHQEPRQVSPTTPKIPWELYDITATESGTRPEVAEREKIEDTIVAAWKPQDEHDPHDKAMDDEYIPTGPGPLPKIPKLPKRPKKTHQTHLDTTGAAAQDLHQHQDDLAVNDPHDKAMDDEYIPTGPAPLPKLPKLLKGPKKRPRKQRPSPLPIDRTSPLPLIRDPAMEDTPFPFLDTAPPHPPVPEAATSPLAEADPGIWNLGTRVNPVPQHGIRPYPARRGNVYCETCFRDDLARWARVRDGVLRVLWMLGGNEALGELRALAREVEEAERVVAEGVGRRSFTREGGRKGPSVRLGSPMPESGENTSSSEEGEEEGSESDDEDERPVKRRRTTHTGEATGVSEERGPAKLTAKKIIVVSDLGRSWEALHFNDHPVDVVGLVLLRVLVERPTWNLSTSRVATLKEMLEDLRQDIGIGSKFFDSMTTLCTGLLLYYRQTRPQQLSPAAAGGFDRWWWDFDQALQAASSRHSTTNEPSFFAGTLAAKASDAAIATLIAQEAATAQVIGHDFHQAGILTQLEQTLGLTAPSNVFLKTIGNKLAQARRELESTIATNKRQVDPSSTSPPSKRRKHPATILNPNSTITSTLLDTLLQSSPINSTQPSPLPCTYCSESAASNYQQFLHQRVTHLGHANAGTSPQIKPWTKPLMWSFHLPLDAVTRITKAEDWFRLVESSRDVAVVQVPDPDKGEPVVKFMVDVTGGRTRVVLMELRGVFECALRREGNSSRARAETPTVLTREGDVQGTAVAGGRAVGGFAAARPVGRWENWRGGRLEGFTQV